MSTRRRILTAVVASALTGFAAAAPAFADEYVGTATSGVYVEPPAGATVVIPASRDDVTVSATLPFGFTFFGRPYDRVSISDNGWLAFGSTTATESVNSTLPSAAAPNAVAAPLWDDLHTGTGSVKTFTTGAAPDRRFVVAWHHVDTFSGATDDDLSFQVLLHEGTGVIEFAYAFAADGVWDGLSYTAGVEDDTGAQAFGAPDLDADNSGRPSSDWRLSPTVVVIAGQVLRDRPVASATGLGTTTETDLPVVGADIAVVREDTGETLGTTRTGSDGGFSVAAFAVEPPITLALDLLASGEESRVTDAAGAIHRRRIASGISAEGAPAIGTVRLDDSVDAVQATFRRALNVQQAARRGFAWARDAAAAAAAGSSPPVAAETFPPLELRWVPGAAPSGGSSYTPVIGTSPAMVQISDAPANPDPYDDDVVLREVGHHVFATISVHPGPAPHIWTAAAPSEGAAFADGFAHWFAAALQQREQFIDTTSADAATVFDLELPLPSPPSSPSATGAVAASLFDLVDAADEAHDEFAGDFTTTAQQVFAAIDQRLDALPADTTQFTIRSFFDVWRTEGPIEDRQSTARIFIHHGALPDDASEPNDHAGEEAAFAAGTQKLTGRTLNPFNEDRFAIALATGGDPLSVAFVQQGAAEVDVEILDAGGAALATGTNAGASDRTRLVVTTPSAVAAGDYVVRVAPRGTTTTTYDVSFFTPLRVATTALPEWTQGEPFKVDLAAAGGVPPLTFELQQGVPGLAAANANTRLTGTPTLEGDYTVQVTVTDASGLAQQATADLPLRINPPLTLPELFAVAAERTVAVDLGTGGTAALWTAGDAPPAGLALAGGATLRLSGATGAPRTFEISGSATDSVGASLPETSSRVVVAAPFGGAAITVPAGTHFGLWFDAIAGSRADLRLRFTGTGPTPRLASVLDAEGREIDVAALADEHGRRARIAGLVTPATGRFFAVFENAGFTGSVSARARVRPPSRGRGIVAIAEPSAIADVQFEAIAGSRLHVLVRRAPAPTGLVPRVFAVVAPDGAPLTLPRQRGTSRRATLAGLLLPQTGTYRLRLASDGETTGPLYYEFVVRSPRGAAYSAD